MKFWTQRTTKYCIYTDPDLQHGAHWKKEKNNNPDSNGELHIALWRLNPAESKRKICCLSVSYQQQFRIVWYVCLCVYTIFFSPTHIVYIHMYKFWSHQFYLSSFLSVCLPCTPNGLSTKKVKGILHQPLLKSSQMPYFKYPAAIQMNCTRTTSHPV